MGQWLYHLQIRQHRMKINNQIDYQTFDLVSLESRKIFFVFVNEILRFYLGKSLREN